MPVEASEPFALLKEHKAKRAEEARKNRANPSVKKKQQPGLSGESAMDKTAKKRKPAKNYTFSDEALSVLEKAKKEGHTLNEFVSSAVVEYGKTILNSGDSPSLEKRQKILERVVAAIGMQLLKELDPKDKRKILNHAKKNECSPYDGGLAQRCVQSGRATGLLSGKDTSPLWWTVFYAVDKGMV